MKPFLLLITSLTVYCTCFAQGKLAFVRGMITDSTSGQPLEQASVSLLRQYDSVVIRQALSGKNGFEFRRVAAGKYFLSISFIGYRPDTIRLTLDDANESFNAGTIKMARSDGNLMEVVVKSIIPPVIVKNDTLVYNANAVATQPNATVEDLLKKLPGIEVDKSGNITLNGQKVEKIYIDGKEFFLNDPKTATQNLTADMVEAIEAFDNQSERAKLTGIKETDVNKALNLRLKKDKKKGFFGNFTVNAGTVNNYGGNTTATYFKGNRWAFANLSGNYADNLTPTAGLKQSGNSQSINYRDHLGIKTQVVANYKGTGGRNESGQSYKRETFLEDSSLLQTRSSRNDNRSTNHNFNFNFTYSIDSLSTIIYTPSVQWHRTKSMNADTSFIVSEKEQNSYLSNEGQTMNRINSEGSFYSNYLVYRRRFRKKGRSIYAQFTQSHQEQIQEGKLYSSVKIYDDAGTLLQHRIVDQQYDQESSDNNYRMSISYTEPIRPNHVIDIGYGMNTSSGVSEKLAFNYNPVTGQYDQPDTLTTNKFNNSNTQQNFNLSYNYIGKNVQYQAGMSVLLSTLENESNNNKFPSIEQSVVNWSPRASAFYRLSKQRNLRIQYNGNSMAPTTEMLQPIPDLSNPFLVRLGNPSLKQQFRHRVSINSNGSNTKKLTNLTMQLGAEITSNKIVQSSTLTAAGIQELQYVNVNGVYSVNGNLNYGFALNKTKNGGGQLSARWQYSRDINYVNGKQNIREGFMWGPAASLNYHVKEKFYASVNASLNYTRSAYSIGNNRTTELYIQNYGTNITYVLPLSIRLTSEFNLQINSRQENLPGRTIAMWNAYMSRNVFRSNKGEIRFSAFDLLNRNTGFNQTIGDNFIETREQYVLQRYFTLSFRYNFRVNVM